MQKVKITKRERKAGTRNHMVESILTKKETKAYDLSDRTYVGLRKGPFGGPGIPFVRV